MFTRLIGPSTPGARLRSLMGGWFLIFLFLQSACATGAPWGSLTKGSRYESLTPQPAPNERVALLTDPGLKPTAVYELVFMEPGAVAARPIPINTVEFKRAFQRLAQDVRLGMSTPRDAARELLDLSRQSSQDVEVVASRGEWNLEAYRGQTYTLVPEKQDGPVSLTPESDAALKAKYLKWCEHQGGGDCLGLLDDGLYLRTDDRRTLALALAFGAVLDETRDALARELLEVRALVSMVVWTVALYCMLWVVPEPTTKFLGATLTVILMGWLGLQTVYGLIDGWARLANAAHEATTFEELRAAGAEYGGLLGEDAARAMILAAATLTGRALGDVISRVKSLPGYGLAGVQWTAQGGAAALTPELAVGTALARESALAKAVAAVEMVATSPQGPMTVVMLKNRPGNGVQKVPGGRSCETVIRHRAGNRQVELSDGQRWHLPRGKSVADIPPEDKVGDQLQKAVSEVASRWGPEELSGNELAAIAKAEKRGERWLARLLEREARGRFVENEVSRQFKHLYDFSRNRGVDVIDPAGYRYEILSGTESNLARHGRRMAGEFFRMLTF